MKKIGLLSDTHAYLNQGLFSFFEGRDEIWHAGDIGNIETHDRLSAFKPLRAVHGNIDGAEIRKVCPRRLRFTMEGVDVFMVHIGGYPGKYDKSVYHEIMNSPPGLFISGHSHILKVMPDKPLGLLHVNPGAAGKYGLHQVATAVRFTLDKGRVKELEVLEMEKV